MPHKAVMRISFLPAFVPAVLLAGCVAPSAPPPPPAAPMPTPGPAAPLPPPPPLAADWNDWPFTPGDWQYRGVSGGSAATFGQRGGAPLATLTCDAASRRVTLMLATPRPAPGTVAIRTTSTQRTLPVQPVAGGVAATLASSDRLLDAMGFSRGRFVIEGAGVNRLVLPAWAEILRVTEDCRR